MLGSSDLLAGRALALSQPLVKYDCLGEPLMLGMQLGEDFIEVHSGVIPPKDRVRVSAYRREPELSPRTG